MILRALLLPAVLATLALSACGGSSSSDSTSTPSTSTATTATTTTSSGGATADVEKICMDAAATLTNADSRAKAEAGCKALPDNADVTEALTKTKQKCLEAAAKVPIASLQETAVEACNKIKP
jgi:hypothetical protein